jgi:menaquinone-specific isochorismate synthase
MSLESIVIDPSRLPTTLAEVSAGSDLYALPDSSGVFPQIAWADSATGERWLGLGAADRVETNDPDEVWSLLDRLQDRLRQIDAPPRARGMLRYWGGIAFDPSAGPHPDWPAGTAARFVLPQVLLRQARPDRPATVAMIGDSEGAAAILRSIREARDDGTAPGRLTLRRLESAEERPRWEAAVREAIRRIDPSAMRKIVLSRDIRFAAEESIDPWALYSRITRQTPHGVQFCFRFDGDGTLIGATPERLVGLDGRRVSCDCLAGTIRRGRDEAEDGRLAQALLASEKDRREHRLVLEGILEALAPLTLWRESPASPFVLRLPRVQHLSTPVRGWLDEAVSLSELIARLHPTPAVGGSPKHSAMASIRELEPRPRGWYAGPIGWVGLEAADFAVGIRSAIVRGASVTVIGGAGIVHGSDPAAEWEETARKAASFLSLFAETED